MAARPLRLFLAATGQNRGKTTTSLGLAAAITARGHRLAFMKPVGQRYVMVDGSPADEDAVLMKAAFSLPDALDTMSPITLPRHFTTDFIMGRIRTDLPGLLHAAAHVLERDRDILLLEGTGHAGVGGVIGLSNARVAAMLEAPVIIVSEGGVGRPIDEIVLNQALFTQHGVRVMGAVVNKVDVERHPDLPELLARGLEPYRIELLGCIPFSPLLANSSLELIATHLEGELLAGQATPGAPVGGVEIGAMRAEHAGPFLRDRALLVTPGDRSDMLSVALEANREAAAAGQPARVAGVVLTGGVRPPAETLAALNAAGLFSFLVPQDTYAAAQAIDAILVKTHPGDHEKIETIIRIVGSALDVDAVLARA